MPTSRLPKLTKAELDHEQLSLHAKITSGPRASGPQYFALQDEQGTLNGPFGVMLHAPGLGGPLQELGAAIRFRRHLTSRVREIAILAVAAATDSAFERYAHERVGLAAGLNEAELAALRAGSFVSDNPTEAAAHALCVRLLHQPGPLGDADYQNAEAILGSEGILELTVLVGYYRMLAQLMNVFGIDAPSP